jgi:hypothetical protein
MELVMTQPQLQSIAPGTLPHGRLATPAGVPGHDVQFYEAEEFLVSTVAKFLAEGIRAGQPGIVIATEGHRRQFAEALRQFAQSDGRLLDSSNVVWLDARQTLNTFMAGTLPDRERFFATLGNVFDRVIHMRSYIVVRAYGEMVDLLWKDGNVDGAIALEELWNELSAKYSFTLLCAYAMDGFNKEEHTPGFQRICAQHEHAMPTEEYLEANDADRLRQLALLQQRARALDAEVQRRMELESALRGVLERQRAAEEMLRRREAELEDLLDQLGPRPRAAKN